MVRWHLQHLQPSLFSNAVTLWDNNFNFIFIFWFQGENVRRHQIRTFYQIVYDTLNEFGLAFLTSKAFFWAHQRIGILKIFEKSNISSINIYNNFLLVPCFLTFIDFTWLISLGFSVFNADTAASRAGNASARSPSHSVLMPCATAAASFATASSAETTYMKKIDLIRKNFLEELFLSLVTEK